MNYSGIVVTTRPEATDRVADGIASLAGVEVHVRHEPSGRLVVVLESDGDTAFEDAFRDLRAAPGVLSADLVYHLVDREPGGASPPPSAPDPAAREERRP